MSDTHTPGPWNANGDAIIAHPNGVPRLVAAVAKERDAHLIAAAPDLLHALEFILELSQNNCESPLAKYNNWRLCNDAINKARGEE
jgi:hypothetical protein